MGDLTREQASLLLYLETCLVDGRGHVDDRKINEDDRATLEGWVFDGYVGTAESERRWSAFRVRFGDEAWRDAHRLRRERAERHTPSLGAEHVSPRVALARLKGDGEGRPPGEPEPRCDGCGGRPDAAWEMVGDRMLCEACAGKERPA